MSKDPCYEEEYHTYMGPEDEYEPEEDDEDIDNRINQIIEERNIW